MDKNVPKGRKLAKFKFVPELSILFAIYIIDKVRIKKY